MIKVSTPILTVMFFLFAGILNGQVYEWRGPERNGIIPETGLMKSWPENGPDMAWSYEGLGDGHGSIGPAKDRFFILGLEKGDGILF